MVFITKLVWASGTKYQSWAYELVESNKYWLIKTCYLVGWTKNVNHIIVLPNNHLPDFLKAIFKQKISFVSVLYYYRNLFKDRLAHLIMEVWGSTIFSCCLFAGLSTFDIESRQSWKKYNILIHLKIYPRVNFLSNFLIFSNMARPSIN